jgi:hypothetical protein
MASNGGFYSKFDEKPVHRGEGRNTWQQRIVLENVAGFGASGAPRKFANQLVNWRRKFACSRFAQLFAENYEKD